MQTFSSLLELLDEDFQNNSSMANRALGKFIAEFAIARPDQTRKGVVENMHRYFWGDTSLGDIDTKPLTELLHRLGRANGFDYADVATHVLYRHWVIGPHWESPWGKPIDFVLYVPEDRELLFF